MPTLRVPPLEVNPYDVLRVPPTASLQEIRERFRRLVIQAHPDKNPERPEWAERRIRELIVAFEMVSDSERRADVDRRLGHRRRKSKAREKPFFFYRQDPEARAMLILHHLMRERGDLALELLEEMEAKVGPNFLSENLDRPDYLDCLFMLGEHHAASRQYLLASKRYRAIYALESKARYPRHYLDEVIRRLKDLYLKKLPRHASAPAAIEGLTQVECLRLTRSEDLLRLRKLAGLQVDSGEFSAARDTLLVARKRYPSAKGFEKIEKTLETAAAGA